MHVDRARIFHAVKALRKGEAFTLAEVRLLDAAIDAAFAPESQQEARTAPIAASGTQPAPHRRLSPKGRVLIHSFEQCRLDAYPDPGSKDGKPWTIGWGSTGPDIVRGLKWTQAECDVRFERDIAVYEQAVDRLTAGAATNQNQFDAMVSLCYNIGIGAFQKSTVLRKHRAGDYHGAAAAFLMWVKNDGKVMRGLQRRRAAEADLYDDPA
jgi:GH24 family phage-related lysozyme (muramidase)